MKTQDDRQQPNVIKCHEDHKIKAGPQDCTKYQRPTTTYLWWHFTFVS